MAKTPTCSRPPVLGPLLLLVGLLSLGITHRARAQELAVASSHSHTTSALDQPPPQAGPAAHSKPRQQLDLEVRRYRRVKLAGTAMLALYIPTTAAAGVLLSSTQRACERRCRVRHTPVPFASLLFTAPVLIGAATAFAIGRRRLRHLDYATPTISLSTHGIELGFGATF